MTLGWSMERRSRFIRAITTLRLREFFGADWRSALESGSAIGLFAHWGWGWGHWGVGWHNHAVFYNHSTYITHSATVINRGFNRPGGPPRNFGARGAYARPAGEFNRAGGRSTGQARLSWCCWREQARRNYGIRAEQSIVLQQASPAHRKLWPARRWPGSTLSSGIDESRWIRR